MKRGQRNRSGFTIVELLIVIVVIAILAAISVVAYNGIQERARYSRMQSDLSSINKAIQLYHADKGHYPYSGSTGSHVNAYVADNTFAIPGLVPDYIPKVPVFPGDSVGGWYAYLWSANGANYKLVRLVPSGVTVPVLEQSGSNADTNRPGRGWGYWSAGGNTL